MEKIWIISSIAIITGVFIYSMSMVSSGNLCTWVRIFDCQKTWVSAEKYLELKSTWDIFLKNCIPKINEEEDIYFIDYSSCNLKVGIKKDQPWVDKVNVNNIDLTRDEINSNF